MLQKNKQWESALLSPTELGRFLTLKSGWEKVVSSPLHNLFQINRIESFRQFIKLPLTPHRKTVYEFVFLTSGSMVRSKDIESFTITENMFFFLPAYQLLTYEMMSDEITGYYCHFDIEIFNKRYFQPNLIVEFPFFKYSGNPIVEVPSEQRFKITPFLDRLEMEYLKGEQASFDLISSYLLTLLLEVKAFVPADDAKIVESAVQITQQYKEALLLHVYDYQKTADFARFLNISPNYLNKCVQATTGKSAHAMLADMILLESKALLKQTELSISEIAYKIGKKDHSDFSRFFKAYTGMTPKEYRKM
jgi:AraC family transcriptional regulator, transcriptional activator of pobA